MILRESEIRAGSAKTEPLIAIDFSTFDYLGRFGGMYRYTVTVVKALAELGSGADFILLGSAPEPLPELREVVRCGSPSHWRYLQVEHCTGRGAYWLDQVRYARILRRERATLYHSLHGLVPLLAPCPVVITQHDLMFELFPEYLVAVKSRGYRQNRWAVRQLAKRVICISETTARDLHELWAIDRARIDVIPHGSEFVRAADSCCEGRIDVGIPHEKAYHPVLVSPYNLEPRKNLTSLLRAVAQVRIRYPSLRLVLFGRGAVTPEREAEFQRMVHELKLDEVIELTGYIEDGDLKCFYRTSDLFVFPSLYEGFGLPVLEAMACGACVIARNASAMAEVVGDAGVLVETQSADILSATISTLLDDPGRRKQLGEAARRRADDFSTERMAKSTYRSYLTAFGKAFPSTKSS
jgi:glycosyltransferase involved in cell wall biosynthesis